MATRFLVEFDDPAAVFYAGHNVSGWVVVDNMHEKLNVKYIQIRFIGTTNTHWAEGFRFNNIRQIYEAEEILIDQRMTVWTSEKHREERRGGEDDEFTVDGRGMLPPGTHMLPFSFQLPSDCPSSFEGAYGQIRYFCEASMAREWDFDRSAWRPFTVIAPYDLTADPYAQTPVAEYIERSLRMMCFSAGKFGVQVHMPKRGFVCGELMPFTLEIRNESNEKIEKITARLMQISFYTGRHFNYASPVYSVGEQITRSFTDQCVFYVRTGPILQNGQSEIWSDSILVPDLPPTLEHSSLIQIRYQLEFAVVPSGFSRPVYITVPVIIGATHVYDTAMKGSYEPIYNELDDSPPVRRRRVKKNKMDKNVFWTMSNLGQNLYRTHQKYRHVPGNDDEIDERIKQGTL